MAKKDPATSSCRCRRGKANPSPPIGPALGQRGLNIMEFCKAFNAKTQKMEKGMPIPVVITVFYQDKSFTFVMKTPPASYFLKKAAKIEVGLQEAGPRFVGKVTMAQVARSPKQKMKDLNCERRRAAMKIIGLRPFDGPQVVG
jgi:large subunit ribosomal protein L11